MLRYLAKLAVALATAPRVELFSLVLAIAIIWAFAWDMHYFWQSFFVFICGMLAYVVGRNSRDQ